MIKEANYIQKLKNLSDVNDLEYLEIIAYVLRLGVLSSGNLYGLTVNNMLEILDQDEDFINELYIKCESIVKKQEKISKANEGVMIITDFLEDFFMQFNFPRRDCVAYATICTAFFAWKQEYLIMEEYYEIRDMFVPFGISITEDTVNINELYKAFQKSISKLPSKEFLMLVKMGKVDKLTFDFEEITIKDAFNEIYFDEMAND